MLGSVNQLAVTVGLLFAYVMGVLCKWRWLAFIGAVSPAVLVILMFSMPETPRWSLGKNRRSEALRALLWLRGPNVDIEEECFAIEATLGKANFPWLLQTHHSFRKKVFFKDQENLLSDPLKILTVNFLSKFDSFQGILLYLSDQSFPWST